MNKEFADIIVDISCDKLDRTFQYRVPEFLKEQIKPGMLVKVPFGNGKRLIRGYVVNVTGQPSYQVEKMKEIKEVVQQENSLESRLIALAAWIRQQYGSTMIQALKTVLPVKHKMKEKEEQYLSLAIEKDQAQKLAEMYHRKHYVAKERILRKVLEQGTLSKTQAVQKLSVSSKTLFSMERQGIFQIRSQIVYRNPVLQETEKKEDIELTEVQEKVVFEILQGWYQGDQRPSLIRGVTGSGKTLIYMKIIEKVLQQKKQAILLIPEIALTYQNVQRFYQKFGDKVSVLHSRLSQGERSDQFSRAQKGEVEIMIGPRSALFTPFPNLGLIIIDEEHETSYQSETMPCYHARETAIQRGKLENCPVILGSATPSVDAYWQAKHGNYRLFELETRYEDRELPSVEVVDLRKELRQGNRSILSRSLQDKMKNRLEKKQQILLFLNRRGYAGFFSCRSCGTVMKCPHCDVSLSIHKHGKMVCHYCGYETRQPERCPTCGSPFIGGFRVGTQQIEDIVKRMFPQAKVLRMDLDTTRKKDSYQSILSSFEKGEADILIGTQMIVKGHDFPKVTLVGVLAADLSLNTSDYRSGERTFQLLTQAVGRAGRGKEAGEAVIQTYQPEHYSIQAAVTQNYPSFFEKEIGYRQLLSYPPASHLFAIHGSGMEEQHLSVAMEYIRQFLKKIDGKGRLQVIGPADETVAKVADMYRKVIYIKQEDHQMLLYVKEQLERYIEINKGFNKIRIQFEFDH